MNILVLSDTHGNYPLAIKALDAAGPVDHIVHLGDGLDDAVIIEDISGLPTTKVVGNCDFSSSAVKDAIISLAGQSIFITHGHRYSVKSGLDGLYRKALDGGASVVLFGHTHLPLIENVHEVLFINPGCLSQSCQTTTYAMLSIICGKVTARIVPVA
ncbi:manganese/nickel-dependent phosphodiesterase, YfcE family [Geotalea daltonii FRC-32]|uniref:Phosphoesterase n=1 Tax=Geotalea daltonii (strain DSM 22248 / JCM 15807 / FRC-32) TaxID=316067 RepID=B9M2Q4_GEODF|nr:YfcE family phosphodiesterase [Geotalea daltonii]ACM21250.1 manganese/nickel-dependent phosphodiesterase, YfcE family [Geotalea daltonii FRC-32]